MTQRQKLSLQMVWYEIAHDESIIKFYGPVATHRSADVANWLMKDCSDDEPHQQTMFNYTQGNNGCNSWNNNINLCTVF